MKIALSKIKASPHPIRSSWDEEKMDQLKWSLMEEGQVEPVGVHESANGYTIVWGHRRVEAARRAAWAEIEAVVIPQNEVNNLIQAGIENLTGEDMSVDDKAEWAFRLVELGLSQLEISRRSAVPNNTISKWLTYREEKRAGVFLKEQLSSRDEGFTKIIEIATSLGNDIEAKKVIATKASQDRLSQGQTRSLADAYRDAPTPEIKQQILKTPIITRDQSADILRRATHHVEMEQGVKSIDEMNDWEKEREERKTSQAYDFAVKEFIDAMRLFREQARKGPTHVKFGKYSPEAARYVERKIDELIGDLKNYREALEGVR